MSIIIHPILVLRWELLNTSEFVNCTKWVWIRDTYKVNKSYGLLSQFMCLEPYWLQILFLPKSEPGCILPFSLQSIVSNHVQKLILDFLFCWGLFVLFFIYFNCRLVWLHNLFNDLRRCFIIIDHFVVVDEIDFEVLKPVRSITF